MEEETFLDEEVALETHRNCLLLNFPIMYAVKLEQPSILVSVI